MAEEKPTVDRALDLFVYAPVGFALYVRDMFPSMMGIFVSRGKREVKAHLGGDDVPTPSTPPVPVPDVGELRRRVGDGLDLARGAAAGGIGLARDVTGSALQGFLSWRNQPAGGHPAPPPAAFTSPASASQADHAAAAAESTPLAGMTPDAAPTELAPPVESLPIPDYDELSASQVIERLEGLDRVSLEAIRAYEVQHRGRNTILGKIAQLT